MDLQGKVEKVIEFEGYTLLSYMARGHVDKGAFIAEVQQEFEDEYTVDFVEHGFARFVPVGKDMPGQMIILHCERGRGAFPITVIDLETVHLLKITETLEEHPENYNGLCICQTCRSYVDS